MQREFINLKHLWNDTRREREREIFIYIYINMCVLNSTAQPDAQKSEKPGKEKLSSNLHPRTTELGIFLEIYFTTTTKTQQKLLEKPEMSIDFRRFSQGFSSLGPCFPARSKVWVRWAPPWSPGPASV